VHADIIGINEALLIDADITVAMNLSKENHDEDLKIFLKVIFKSSSGLLLP